MSFLTFGREMGYIESNNETFVSKLKGLNGNSMEKELQLFSWNYSKVSRKWNLSSLEPGKYVNFIQNNEMKCWLVRPFVSQKFCVIYDILQGKWDILRAKMKPLFPKWKVWTGIQLRRNSDYFHEITLKYRGNERMWISFKTTKRSAV